MKTIKLTLVLLISIVFSMPGIGFAQTQDKKSEDAIKVESEVNAQTKEKQEKTEDSMISAKDKDEEQKKYDQETDAQTKKKGTKKRDPQFEGSEDVADDEAKAAETKDKGKGYHTLKEERAKKSPDDLVQDDAKKEAPPKETPPGKEKEEIKEKEKVKVKEKEHSSRSASEHAPGHVKKEDVEKAKQKAIVSVQNTENVVLSTEQKVAVAKEKLEDARLRLDEKKKKGLITEQEFHEKMLRISAAEEKIVSIERDLNADKQKIDQTKKVVDKPAKK